MYRKIALILLFITLIVVGFGIYIFHKQKKGIEQIADGSQIAIEQPSDSIQQPSDAKPSEKAKKPAKTRTKAQLEKEIDTRITIKANKIIETGQNRLYTDDELDFISNPRKNIIDNMYNDGEMTEDELKLLD